MPRGVAIPEVRQQLFAAVERVILRDGPGGLRGRAITTEAQVATGLLYAHFRDLDDFLTGYAVDRSFTVAAHAGRLRECPQAAAVADNLCRVLESTPLDPLRALARLFAARPDLTGPVRDVLGDNHTGIDAVEAAVTDYLATEQRRGRLTANTDVEALATALTATLHRLALTTDDTQLAKRLRRTVSAVVDGFTAATGAGHTAPERPRAPTGPAPEPPSGFPGRD